MTTATTVVMMTVMIATRIRYADAAAYLGLTVEHLRVLVYRRQIPHLRLGGRTVVFERAALDDWLDARRVPVGGVR